VSVRLSCAVGGPEVRFGVHDNRDWTPALVRLKAVCGPGDGSPYITVMLPEED
jgi:hypothetical protein